MLREKPVEVKAPNSLESDAFPAESSMRHKEYELDELDLPALHEKYKRVLVQAYVLDEATRLFRNILIWYVSANSTFKQYV